ncbi:hypothetical protein AYR62_10575 [Secundilactobacillus paracollinoides]|uniref:Uncharacterized protein n=1 Tax=Secundilactobacillus paracollinoides TaxID=240427 RepID=A0A1B2IYE1_9LACO|nr:hypothetical protein [Secundilactobacillus paracollinoides]ANZ61120.1 hypothetical protein AYR61_07055 [Secundilactobacillus paracollinoides]ANZ64485.1 hypothetical protein AYR62_10575 [Secundilactobacillus paracollinoides]ANZ67041.1 hypothetical protein AYR63_07800 [Secundilactobacillus paracollinoides]KRL76038.1 hypothetical protein FC17_GL002085 [Secundilactobacillus paracollinoides DSM 15502 = JCM 11969]
MNKQLKFNRTFYKNVQFWLGIVVLVMGAGSLLSEAVSSIYFWLDIAMILLGIITVIDDMILHRRPVND